MIASEESRVLFVHVQKTGGLTVEGLLLRQLPGAAYLQGLPGAKHATWATAAAHHPATAGYWTFGFVRNPWSRLYSWWAMVMRRQELAEAGDEQVRAKIAANSFWTSVIEEHPSFESFVLRGPDHLARLRRPQLDYLELGGRRADFIGRTETFADDLREAFTRLGLTPPGEVPHHNAGPRIDWRAQYTPPMRRRVERLFDADIRAFDYTF